MFTLIFFLSAVAHVSQLDHFVALMPDAIPWRPFWVLVSGVVEFVGATLILTNRYPRLGAWLIVTSTHFAPSPAEPIKATSLAQPKSQASIS